MGLLAREFEQGQITQLLNTTAPESPEYLMLLKSFYENSTLTTKDEMLALIEKRLEESMNSQNIPPEMVQQKIAEIQQQAQQMIQQATKEAEQKAQEAINQAKAFEARCNQQVRDIQKKAQIDLSAEKVTNAAKEDVISLDFKRKEFELQKKVALIEDKYEDEINRIKEAIADEEKREAEQLIAEAKETENQEKEVKMSEKMEAVTLSVAPMEKLLAELKSVNEAKEKELSELRDHIKQHMMSVPTKADLDALNSTKADEINKVVAALEKPRKVVRNKTGEITGVE
jgi:F0F1-type ATP synthase membrane subunit b/b'